MQFGVGNFSYILVLTESKMWVSIDDDRESAMFLSEVTSKVTDTSQNLSADMRASLVISSNFDDDGLTVVL